MGKAGVRRLKPEERRALQRVWAVVRDARPGAVTAPQVARYTGLPADYVRHWLARLARERILARLPGGGGRDPRTGRLLPHRYAVVQDIGPLAPICWGRRDTGAGWTDPNRPGRPVARNG